MKTSIFYSKFSSPFAELHIASTEKGICHIGFPPGNRFFAWVEKTFGSHYRLTRDQSKHKGIHQQLSAYFNRELTAFALPLDMHGTQFQKSVWERLRKIPYGQTVTYGDIAAALGDMNQSRAVGAANGANPIPIIVPCHRVIGRDGKLVGYSGGLHIKEWLLKLEGIICL